MPVQKHCQGAHEPAVGLHLIQVCFSQWVGGPNPEACRTTDGQKVQGIVPEHPVSGQLATLKKHGPCRPFTTDISSWREKRASRLRLG